MSKNKYVIYLAYQDCALCKPGDEKVWELAKRHSIQIEKVPFHTKAGAELIKSASKHGFKSLPVYFDGSNYAYSLEELVEKWKELRTEVKLAPKTKKGKKHVAKK